MNTLYITIGEQLVKTWDVTSANGIMMAHKVHNEYNVNFLQSKGVNVDLKIVDKLGNIVFKGFDMCLPSKMNDPEYKPPDEWFDDIIKNYQHP